MSKASTGSWIGIAVILAFFGFILLFKMGGGCTDAETATDVLNKAGYQGIEIKDDYQFWTCGSGDHYATGFSAINPTGKRVEGTVCCGWAMKGCTIRF